MLQEKAQWSETLWVQNQTIVKKTIKMILKFGWKIPNFNLSAKILKRVDHLWNQLPLVQKRQTQKHQKWKIQHVKLNHGNIAYQRTQSQTQIRQTHLRVNLIRPKTLIIKAKDAIKKELPEKETGHYQIMHKINGKVADNNV